MATTPRVFVVTGSNKGVGKSIVKLLLQDKEEKIVYLTSRNPDLGKEAVQDLQAVLGVSPRYHQLDITDTKSVEGLCDHLVQEHGGLDVLVNNAGIAYKGASTAPFSEQAKVTNDCNFFGTVDVCEKIFPILKENGRVSHVSSMMSEYTFPKLSSEWQAKFGHPDITMNDLKSYVSQFVADAQEDKVEERGWPKSAYGMSKVGVSIMTNIQQKQFDAEGKNVVVNSCCPGIVDTDMTGGKYQNMLTPDQGADTPTYLALLPKDTEVRGCFVKLRKAVPYPPC